MTQMNNTACIVLKYNTKYHNCIGIGQISKRWQYLINMYDYI